MTSQTTRQTKTPAQRAREAVGVAERRVERIQKALTHHHRGEPMTDTTAKIRSKGLDATGVTEDIANQMYASKGAYYMAIVELKVEERHEKAEGARKVDLVLTQVEPATDDELVAHLRQLTRTLHQNRTLNADDKQLVIETLDDLEPTVEGVIAAGQQHIAQTDDALPEPDEGDEPDGDAVSDPETEPDDEDDVPAPGTNNVEQLFSGRSS